MKTPTEKANELIEKYLNLPIYFPYIDTVDDLCIGTGYMIYHSAIQCAIIAVDEMINAMKNSYHSISLSIDIAYWQSVKTELETLKN